MTTPPLTMRRLDTADPGFANALEALIAFESAQDPEIDAAVAAMGADAKITLGPLSFDDFIPGWRTVWVADPDGNIVEISQGYTDQANVPQL